MMSKPWRVIVLVVLSLVINMLFAVPLPSASSGFITKQKVPEGFEHLDAESETILDVYYGGAFIGSYDARYTPTYVIFTRPDTLVKQLKNIINPTAVTSALTGKLSANSKLVCASNFSQNCGVLLPKVAGIILDASKFRVDIFVNPSYLYGQNKQQRLLPGSDADFSYINNIQAAVSGTGNQASYNLNSQNVVAYREARLNGSISYANTPGTDIEQTQIDNLNAGWNYSRYQLNVGMVNTYSDPLIPTENLLGLSWQTSNDAFIDDGQTYGSPVQVFLYSPSKVNVFRDGRLIGTGFYQAGKQQLNTSTFPDGAYTIQVVIESQTGQTTEETQTFVKTSRLPPLEYPTYYLNAGYIEDDILGNNVLPEYSTTALLQAGIIKRFLPNWGYNFAIVGEPSNAYTTTGIFFINSFLQINPDFLVGNHGEKGVALTSLFNFGKVNASVYANQIWAYYHMIPNATATNIAPDVPVAQDDFSPIVGDSKTLGGALSTSISAMTLSVSGSVNERENQETLYSYGPDIRFPLLNNPQINTSLELSVTRTQDDTVYLATVRAFINPPQSDWTHNLSIGYNASTQPNNTSNTVGNQDGIIASTTSMWHHLNDAQEGVRVGFNTNYYLGQGTLALLTDDDWNYGSFNAQVQQNVSQGLNQINSQNTQYSANLSTHLAYTSELTTFGGSRYGDTGVIVEVTNTHDLNDQFEVLVNNQVRKIIQLNTPTTILLEPYETYHIRIQSVSDTLFEYQEAPRTITLYRGNLKSLIWKTSEKLVLFTKILQPNGKPLGNALIQGGVGINQTDEDGSLQLEIDADTKTLTAKSLKNKSCRITLPDYEVENGVAQLPDIVCIPERNAVKSDNNT